MRQAWDDHMLRSRTPQDSISRDPIHANSAAVSLGPVAGGAISRRRTTSPEHAQVQRKSPPRRRQEANGSRTLLRVAVAQPLVDPGDVSGNVARMQPLVAEAARRGAELIVFSECGITGYDLKGSQRPGRHCFGRPMLDRVAAMAKASRMAIVAGFEERLSGKLHNTAVVFFPDGRRVVQRKHRILSPEKDLAPVVPAARNREIFELKGFRLAIAICSDSGIPGLYEELAAAGCDAVVLPTAGAGNESYGFHRAAWWTRPREPNLSRRPRFSFRPSQPPGRWTWGSRKSPAISWAGTAAPAISTPAAVPSSTARAS